jgi:hypothetical protein
MECPNCAERLTLTLTEGRKIDFESGFRTPRDMIHESGGRQVPAVVATGRLPADYLENEQKLAQLERELGELGASLSELASTLAYDPGMVRPIFGGLKNLQKKGYPLALTTLEQIHRLLGEYHDAVNVKRKRERENRDNGLYLKVQD